MLKQFFSVLFIAALISCSNAQNTKIMGEPVTPGSEKIKADFFEPFVVKGIINTVSKKGETSIFRYINKEMLFSKYNGETVIKQILSYSNKNKELTGVHTTFYNPKTLEVLFWRYDNKKNNSSFAFKTQGTKIMGTQDLKLPEEQWRGADLGVKLFQNESRELFFRGLNVPIGTVIKFPVIGMQPPFHGWVSYTYSKDEKVNYNGKTYNAKIWESSNDAQTFYVVIDKAPYVIKREVQAGKEKHIFSFGT